MKIDYKQHGEFIVVRPEGRLEFDDIDNFSHSMHSMVERLNSPLLIFDLEELEYISSAGLRVFVDVFKVIKDKGILARFARPGHFVSNVFKITCLDQVFPVSKDLEEAMKSLNEEKRGVAR